MRINRTQRRLVDGDPAPDRNDEYRLYQVLLGAWPVELMPRSGSTPTRAPQEFIDRIKAYMLKAIREAKLHTSWLTTNQPYEEALTQFVERILGEAGGAKFLPAFLPLQERVATLAVVNSLSQLVLKLGSPGVPDFYQGTELWDLNLVDPDNRRPVDFETRRQALASLDGAAAGDLLADWPDGRIKLLVTHRGLQLRRALPDVFVGGEYVPLAVETSVDAEAVAFARVSGEDAVIVVAPTLCVALASAERQFPLGGECWKTSRVLLPESLRHRTFRNVFTGAEVRPIVTAEHGWIFLGQALQELPVAMLQAL